MHICRLTLQCRGRVSVQRSGGLGFESTRGRVTPKALKMVLTETLCDASQIAILDCCRNTIEMEICSLTMYRQRSNYHIQISCHLAPPKTYLFERKTRYCWFGFNIQYQQTIRMLQLCVFTNFIEYTSFQIICQIKKIIIFCLVYWLWKQSRCDASISVQSSSSLQTLLCKKYSTGNLINYF